MGGVSDSINILLWTDETCINFEMTYITTWCGLLEY
jgi:hypothetical protein